VSFDRRLLDIVCCPVTYAPLQMTPEATLLRLNARIADGKLRHSDDTPVTEPIEQALMTADGRLAYPIRDDIPLLIEDRAILIAQADEV
jgi:uncharacterized protein YbaR (Trm112 family)